MPVPSHTKYTWSGIFGVPAAPVEQWSFSLKTAIADGAAGVDLEALADGLSLCWEQNFAQLHRPSVVLTRTRISFHGPGGATLKTSDGQYIQGDSDTIRPGTSGAVTTYPIQTAVCVSLVTARAGATGKGRFFLPWMFHDLGADYRLSLSHQGQIRDVAAEFIRDVNLVTQEPVAVVSGTGAISPVTAVKVGRVPDTMRSRRRGLDEQYSTVSL